MKVKFENEELQAKLEAEQRQHPEAQLPESFFCDLLDNQIGRGYLNAMPPASKWEMERAGLTGSYGWLKFNRLPIRPGREEDNTLLEYWQSVLSACHTIGLRLAFVLLRRKGRTSVYLGACARNGNKAHSMDQLRQCMAIHMPGAELQQVNDAVQEDLEETLENFTSSGVVTGIPSLRNDNSGSSLQTLDKLARGIHMDGQDKNYALVVLADPVPDKEIAGLLQTFLDLKGEIHQYGGYTTQESFTKGGSQNTNYDSALGIGGVMQYLAAACYNTGLIGGSGFYLLSGIGGRRTKGRGSNYSTSSSVSREYRNFTVKYCQDLLDQNMRRMERGRNLGFWQTGVYALSEDSNTIDSVLGILRSIYSGQESYVEPIRVFNTSANNRVADFVGRLQFLPLPGSEKAKKEIADILGSKDGWHVLGPLYENFTTAMTTEELSIASSLPRREVPGLRLVKNDVSFASNSVGSGAGGIALGNIVDMGVPQPTKYWIAPNALVRHIMVSGSTGSGKSTTCKKIIQGIMSRNIPVLIVEPAKDDYVRWAIEQNKTLPPDKQFNIIMPGVDEIDGVKPKGLWLSPFQPAAWGNSPVNLTQHAEALATLLNACLPSEDVISILLEETVHECLRYALEENKINPDSVTSPQLEMYPMLKDLEKAGDRVINQKTYEKTVRENYREILKTRFNYLARGTRGSILDCPESTKFEKLFSHPTVVNLSRLSGSKDKSMIMSLLLLALQEYRHSQFQYDAKYRARALNNELLHLTVVEEAHNVLKRPSEKLSAGGDPQEAAAELFGNMLSEIRSTGQGLMIVDQIPSRLIDDALKNTNYKITHRMTSVDDIQAVSAAMLLRSDQSDVIPSLEIGQAIICGDMDDAAAWIKIEP